MNGAHDMGGQQNMGPVEHEKDEPVFHARWEARMYALNRAMRAWGGTPTGTVTRLSTCPLPTICE